jgi:hypothetical protein
MSIDLSGDQALIDGLETVTLQISIGAPPPRIYEDAYRLPEVQVEGDPTQGGYRARSTEWHLSTLGAAIDPQIGDTITDSDDIVWVIQSVRPPKFNDYWGLTCQEFSITDDTDLQDLVTLFKAGRALQPDGSKFTTHAAVAGFTDVPAKIQLRPSTAELLAGQERFIETYDIYVGEDIGQVNAGDILKDATGKNYRIISYRNRELIDDLSTIVCESKPVG